MKDKHEILKDNNCLNEIAPNIERILMHRKDMHNAMDEYAKELLIDFVNYLKTNVEGSRPLYLERFINEYLNQQHEKEIKQRNEEG